MIKAKIEGLYKKSLELQPKFKQKYDNVESIVLEDLISEGFLKVITKLEKESSHPINNLDGYLYNTINHTILEYLRERKKCPVISMDTLSFSHQWEAINYDSSPDKKFKIALQLIEQMSEKDQYLIRWWLMQHKTIEEVAQELGIKPRSVYRKKDRALEKLKRSYEEIYNSITKGKQKQTKE